MTRARNISQIPSGNYVIPAASLTNAGFPSGTRMLFQQTAAPTGWTKDTTHNDKALRVVSGTVSSGGSVAFSAFSAQSIGATTLSVAQMPSHAHGYSMPYMVYDMSGNDRGRAAITGGTTGYAGGSGSHTHSLNMALQYVDLIIATRD